MADAPITRICAVRGLVPLGLKDLWAYRDLAFFMLWRDLKARYKQTMLGPLWMLIGPLVNVLLFTVIFGRLAGLGPAGIPYPLYNYSAVLVWGLFSSSVYAASSSLLDSRHLISKVYFPRLLLPVVGILSALANLCVSLLVLFVMMACYGYAPGPGMLWLPPLLVVTSLCGMAVGLWWASWLVHYWDMRSLLDYILKGWMYACPVVYAASLVPERWRTLYYLNPMANIIEATRWALLGFGQPRWDMLVLSLLAMAPVLIGGAYYFRWTERSIVDIA